MAVAYVADGQDTDDTINSVDTTGAGVDYLVASTCGWFNNASANATGCTWNGDSAAMTLIAQAKTHQFDLESGLWEYIGPTSTTSTISVTTTNTWNGSDGGPAHAWVTFSGVDQTTATDATDTTGGDGNLELSIATTDDDLVLDVMNSYNTTAITFDGDGSPTERWDQDNVNNNAAGATRDSTGTLTCGVSGNQSDSGYAGCNIVAAAAATGLFIGGLPQMGVGR